MKLKQQNFTNEVDLRKLSWNRKLRIYRKIQNTKGFYYILKKNKVLKHKTAQTPSSPNVKGIYYRIFKLISAISKKTYTSLDIKHDIHGFCSDWIKKGILFKTTICWTQDSIFLATTSQNFGRNYGTDNGWFDLPWFIIYIVLI